MMDDLQFFAERDQLESNCWLVAEALQSAAGNGYSPARFASIKRFVAKLGVQRVVEAADIATTRWPYSQPKAFKYFCGVCWNWIKDAPDGL